MTDAGMTLTETQEEGASTKTVAINFPSSTKKITYETMHIASEATHNETQWKFRMPEIERRLKNRIRITSALEKKIKRTAEMENVITYQECTLQHSRSESNSSVELIDAQTAPNSIQCFSFAIPNKGPYLSYVAGNWYASISNPFKFFSSESRQTSLIDIATIIQKIESETMMFFVERKNVGSLVATIVSSFHKSTPIPEDFIHTNLLHWEKHHIWDYAVHKLKSKYWNVSQNKKLSEETNKAREKLNKIYYEFVSLRPVWDNQKRFSALCRGASIEDFSSRLDTISSRTTFVLSASQIHEIERESDSEHESGSGGLFGSSSDEDNEDESEEDSDDEDSNGEDDDNDADREPNYNISYQDLLTKSNAEGRIKKYTNSYVETILEKLNVLAEDKDRIKNDFFKNYDFDATGNDFSINGLIKAMANRANVTPNKFKLLQNMVTGITQSTINIPEVQKKKLGDLEKQIQEKEKQISSVTDDSQKQKSLLQKKLIELKRQVAAFRNPLWIALEANLNKIGIKPKQRAFPKPNFVFSFAEFIIMLKKFSDIEVVEDMTKDFKFLKTFAEYVRSKVWGQLGKDSDPAANDIILALNTIYSKEGCTEFKRHMMKKHDIIDVDFPQFMATLVSVHFITNQDTVETLKARTTTRFNGLRLALRYDMFLEGVFITDLNESDFRKITTLSDTDNSFIFNSVGTKQKGFYIKAPDATPVTQEVNNALVQRNWVLRNRETAKVYQYYAREPKWNNWSRAYIRGNREETIGKLEVVKFVDSDALDTRCIKYS